MSDPGFLRIIEKLGERLQKPLPGPKAHDLMMARVVPMPPVIPEDARPSAVLGLLFPKNGELSILLIKRTEDGRAHSGQISMPGGKRDPDDDSLRATALRELHEEVGVVATDVELVGQLTPLYIPVSNFRVYPFIGYSGRKLSYNLSTHEVAYVLEVPLNELFAPENKKKVSVVSPAVPELSREVQAYELKDGSIIWGATAMILSELEVIYSEIG